MNLLWLVKMQRWAQHPPGPRTVGLIVALLAFLLLLVAIEQIWGWPEALTVDGAGMRGRRN